MKGGYAGKLLWVDLTKGKINIRDLKEKDARKYIGGVGLAAKILWDKTTATTDPFSPENPLIFMLGPLNGTKVPSNSRYTVVAISPLTNVFGQAHSGGTLGYQLKRAGFDGVIIQGRSETPVYLWVNNGKAELRDAGAVWGKGLYETSDILQGETHPKACVAGIGPAGEKLVRIAAIMSDGRDGRAAARCGLGAVMGSKNLKAVVVRGTKAPKVYDAEGLSKSIKAFHKKTRVNMCEEERMDRFVKHRKAHAQSGRISTKNFLGGEFPGFSEKLTEWMIKGDAYYCPTCITSSHECHMINGVRRQVLESFIPLGSNCLIDDMETLQEAFDVCQDYGMDSISTGGVMAFAIEAFEKGIITEKDTDGIKLGYGKAKALLQMVKKIAERDGFGKLLGEGVKRAAEQIGGLAKEYALHIKGLEIPAHDPRTSNIMALEYATESRGADHMSAYGISDRFIMPELGVVEDRSTPENRFKVEGQAEITANLQNYMCVFNSLAICIFLCRVRYGTVGADPSTTAEWVSLATGWDMDSTELLKAGERIVNLKRLFNVRRGMSRKDDMLPPRMMTHKIGGTVLAANHLPNLGELLNQYYIYRGWREDGIPTEEKLAELDLPKYR